MKDLDMFVTVQLLEDTSNTITGETCQESTRIPTCVVLKIAPGGAVNTLCVCRDST